MWISHGARWLPANFVEQVASCSKSASGKSRAKRLSGISRSIYNEMRPGGPLGRRAVPRRVFRILDIGRNYLK